MLLSQKVYVIQLHWQGLFDALMSSSQVETGDTGEDSLLPRTLPGVFTLYLFSSNKDTNNSLL